VGTIIFEDLGYVPGTGGGYYDPESDEIHIDSSRPPDKQMEVLIHEVLESELYKQFKHTYIDLLTSKIFTALMELKRRQK